jgi:hypothetical protein
LFLHDQLIALNALLNFSKLLTVAYTSVKPTLQDFVSAGDQEDKIIRRFFQNNLIIFQPGYQLSDEKWHDCGFTSLSNL